MVALTVPGLDGAAGTYGGGVTKQRQRSDLHLADPQSAAGGGGEVSCRGEGRGTERRRARREPAGRGRVLLLVDWRHPDPAETSQPDLTHTIIDYWLRINFILTNRAQQRGDILYGVVLVAGGATRVVRFRRRNENPQSDPHFLSVYIFMKQSVVSGV